MKKTILTIAEWALYLGVPVFIILSQYHKIYNSYFKVGFTGIILLIIAALLFKKLYVNRAIESLRGEIVNYTTAYRIETDEQKKANALREIKNSKTKMTIYNSIFPLLFLGVGIFAAKGLEAQFLKLSGVLGFMFISVALGVVVSVFKARL